MVFMASSLIVGVMFRWRAIGFVGSNCDDIPPPPPLARFFRSEVRVLRGLFLLGARAFLGSMTRSRAWRFAR